jgi:hypothetical protein
LVASTREAAFEERLDLDDAALHIPGAVFELQIQEESYSALIRGTVRSGCAESIVIRYIGTQYNVET